MLVFFFCHSSFSQYIEVSPWLNYDHNDKHRSVFNQTRGMCTVIDMIGYSWPIWCVLKNCPKFTAENWDYKCCIWTYMGYWNDVRTTNGLKNEDQTIKPKVWQFFVRYVIPVNSINWINMSIWNKWCIDFGGPISSTKNPSFWELRSVLQLACTFWGHFFEVIETDRETDRETADVSDVSASRVVLDWWLLLIVQGY